MYSDIIGKKIHVVIDRPLGSRHPRKPELIYELNYGFVENIIAGDGAEQDVYVLGVDKPVSEFDGVVIAVFHRTNDVEDKWIAAEEGKQFSDGEILRSIHFVEQFFEGYLCR